MYCKMCGKEIPSDSVFCPVCGCAIEQQTPKKGKNSVSKLRVALGKVNPKMRIGFAVVLIILSIICVYKGVNELTSDTYSFYTEFYQECETEHDRCVTEAKYAATYYLEGFYEDLAEDYEEMMADATKELWSMRAKAIVLTVASIACMIFAYLLISTKTTGKGTGRFSNPRGMTIEKEVAVEEITSNSD